MSEIIGKFDFIGFNKRYNKMEVNLYVIKNKNCRDKKKIEHIINNNFYHAKVESELKKLGYYLKVDRKLLPNITIYSIIRNTRKAKKLYGGE